MLGVLGGQEGHECRRRKGEERRQEERIDVGESREEDQSVAEKEEGEEGEGRLAWVWGRREEQGSGRGEKKREWRKGAGFQVG